MTKRELSQLYDLNREIERDKDRLKELEYLECGITMKLTGMPHASGISDKTGNYAVEIADLKAVIELNMDRCWYELRRLNRYIESIDDSELRQIFSLRYINGMTWQQIAFSMGTAGDGSTEKKKHYRFLKVSQNSQENGL